MRRPRLTNLAFPYVLGTIDLDYTPVIHRLTTPMPVANGIRWLANEAEMPIDGTISADSSTPRVCRRLRQQGRAVRHAGLRASDAGTDILVFNQGCGQLEINEDVGFVTSSRTALQAWHRYQHAASP